eukprot:4251560-Pleurochrysis_carterae.AAC.4
MGAHDETLRRRLFALCEISGCINARFQVSSGTDTYMLGNSVFALCVRVANYVTKHVPTACVMGFKALRLALLNRISLSDNLDVFSKVSRSALCLSMSSVHRGQVELKVAHSQFKAIDIIIHLAGPVGLARYGR